MPPMKAAEADGFRFGSQSECRALAPISEDFHDEICEACERCNGLGDRCLAEVIRGHGARRLQ